MTLRGIIFLIRRTKGENVATPSTTTTTAGKEIGFLWGSTRRNCDIFARDASDASLRYLNGSVIVRMCVAYISTDQRGPPSKTSFRLVSMTPQTGPLSSASVSWKVFQSSFNPYPKTPWDNHKSSHLCRMPWHFDKIVVGSILRHTVKLFCHIGKSLVNSTWTFRLQVKAAKNDDMSAVENFTSCSHTNSILQCLFELSGLVHCYKIHVEKIDNVWVKIFGH